VGLKIAVGLLPMEAILNPPFVNLAVMCPSIIFDIRYATKNNFLGFAVYSQPLCFLHIDVAKALVRAQHDLEAIGLCLKVFDGYRPLSVQKRMWDIVQDERFISDPSKNGGRHTRGTAVDVTLVNLLGAEVEMPTGFDDFTEEANSSYQGATKEALYNRTLLRDVMARHAFIQLPSEWWHFDYEGWQNDSKYPPLDINFEMLI
jgi:D-alanyl-D-alanine dipeptidase